MKRLTYQPTSKTYFSGAGGMDLGLIQVGVPVGNWIGEQFMRYFN